MKFNFYGGAGEVGRSCVCLDGGYLFDCGLKISEEGSEYPLLFDYRKIKSVFISHAHLDHTGALPLFNHKGLHADIFCNSMTKELTRVLLKDSLHIEQLESQDVAYSKENIYNVLDSMTLLNFNKSYTVSKNNRVKYLYAGHIPGAASVLLHYNGRNILYTGDVNLLKTFLLDGLDYHNELKNEKIDVMICESTYGDRNHPARSIAEKDFLNMVETTLARGGSVLIPAFAVGRVQEIIMLLAQRNFKVPIYLDGMAKRVSNLFLKQPTILKNANQLSAALRNVKYIKSGKERKQIVKEQGIFVTTSGMLDGGPVIDFLSSMYFEPRHSILLTGYQAEESNGRLLLDEGKVYIDGTRVKVRCFVKKYDFSAHSGRKELVSMINKINPENLILMHGDKPSIESLKGEFQGQCKVYTPRLGDEVNIQ